MSYDVEYELGYVPEPPVRRRYPVGQPWCGRCQGYHSIETGCDDGDDE